MAITQRQKTTSGGSVAGLSNAPLVGSTAIVVWPKNMSGRQRVAKPWFKLP